jgi:hypothetical protein
MVQVIYGRVYNCFVLYLHLLLRYSGWLALCSATFTTFTTDVIPPLLSNFTGERIDYVDQKGFSGCTLM